MTHDVLDIFRVDTRGVRWMDSASSIEDAKLRIQKLGRKIPGEYLVLNQVTGNKLVINIDQMSNADGRWSGEASEFLKNRSNEGLHD